MGYYQNSHAKCWRITAECPFVQIRLKCWWPPILLTDILHNIIHRDVGVCVCIYIYIYVCVYIYIITVYVYVYVNIYIWIYLSVPEERVTTTPLKRKSTKGYGQGCGSPRTKARTTTARRPSDIHLKLRSLWLYSGKLSVCCAKSPSRETNYIQPFSIAMLN